MYKHGLLVLFKVFSGGLGFGHLGLDLSAALHRLTLGVLLTWASGFRVQGFTEVLLTRC